MSIMLIKQLRNQDDDLINVTVYPNCEIKVNLKKELLTLEELEKLGHQILDYVRYCRNHELMQSSIDEDLEITMKYPVKSAEAILKGE